MSEFRSRLGSNGGSRSAGYRHDYRWFRVAAAATAIASGISQSGLGGDSAKTERNVEGIMDNSFFVEEAYNQEKGVVQHIFNAVGAWNKVGGPDDRRVDLVFTQEWPVGGQTHQLSYTIPYSFLETRGQSDNGLGDLLINYRYQAYYDEESLVALAPRVSLVTPTGDAKLGLGNDTWGVQFNLPFSAAVGPSWFVHANAGLTFLPDAGAARDDLLHYHAAASVIYGMRSDLHFLLEWAGVWENARDDSGRLGRDFSCIVSPGIRRAINFNNSQLVFGVAAPFGLTGSAPDYGVFVYLSFEHPLFGTE
jgi:hypothetical protein